MPALAVGKNRIHYWEGRNDSPGKRQVVLFVHGAGGGEFVWVYQKGFFQRGFRPVIIELPGHGASEGEGEEEIGRYAEQVYSFLKALAVSKVFLVGHSMGGAIVQNLALAHPEIIQGIILVGTGAKLRVHSAVLNGIKENFEETVQKIVRYAYSRKAPAELIEKGTAQLLSCRPEVLYGDFLACDRFDLLKEVGKIRLPTLVVCGEEDELTPVTYSEFLHRKIRGSRLKILPDAGHLVMMESPELFNEKVNAFLLNPTVSGNS